MRKSAEKPSINSLGDKVAKLQKLRKSSSATFFNARSDEVDVRPNDEGNSVRQLIGGEQIHSKLKSTVMLLSESLEEQGRLRALLEYTADPNHMLSGNRDSEREKELRYRGAILGHEKLLAEVSYSLVVTAL